MSRSSARHDAIAELRGLAATLIFYESAQRLAETLADLHAVLGTRDAAVCRELTKLHEEVRRGRLSEIAAHYAANPGKGEAVIVIAPPVPAAVDAEAGRPPRSRGSRGGCHGKNRKEPPLS